MYRQVSFATECFITHVTAIWTLPSMYALMELQILRHPERFITDVTAIRTFPHMCNLLCFHGALLPKSSIRSSLLKKEKNGNNITIFKKGSKENGK
jgi:hypothetical protein